MQHGHFTGGHIRVPDTWQHQHSPDTCQTLNKSVLFLSTFSIWTLREHARTLLLSYATTLKGNSQHTLLALVGVFFSCELWSMMVDWI